MPLQPGRAEVKEALSKAISAAQVLEDVLDDDRLREFLEDTPYGPFTRRALFDQDLGDLQDRAKAAINLLSTPDGKTKPGRSRAMPQKAFSSKVFCALIVNEAWKFFHGEYPAPRNRTAAAAAEMLWNSSPSPLMQPPPAKTPGWGADPVDGWRPHLKAARRAELDEMRTELQRQLKEYNRYADISG